MEEVGSRVHNPMPVQCKLAICLLARTIKTTEPSFTFPENKIWYISKINGLKMFCNNPFKPCFLVMVFAPIKDTPLFRFEWKNSQLLLHVLHYIFSLGYCLVFQLFWFLGFTQKDLFYFRRKFCNCEIIFLRTVFFHNMTQAVLVILKFTTIISLRV